MTPTRESAGAGGGSLFRSRIARRIFLLFVLCALLPITILIALSLATFSSEITEGARRDLQRSSKAKGLEIFDNLLIVESRLVLFALGSAELLEGEGPGRGYRMTEEFTFHRVGFHDTLGGAGDGGGWPRRSFTAGEEAHVESGGSLLFSDGGRVYMVRAAPSGVIVAELRKERLWDEEGTIYIFGPGGTALSGTPAGFPVPGAGGGTFSRFEFAEGGRRHLASSWSVFLKGQFMSPPWKVVVTVPRAEILRPIRELKVIFVLVVALTFLIVLLLSISLIRRSLAPIALLREGTERVAAGDLESRIAIDSGDEFEALGDSFNRMSGRIREMQSQLVHGEKIKTIGKMSAAIVHEINQPLQAVMVYLDILRHREDLTGEARDQVGKLASTVDRLGHIAQRFKRFARGSQDVKHAPLSLNAVLVSVEEFLGHQLQRQRCTLSLRLGEGLPPVIGDGGSLQQVFMNLIMNAMDAMDGREGRGGEQKAEITVTTRGEGGAVAALLEDTGPGIPEELREKIFEPFFSTKEEGKGSGLGLAIAREILQRHNGTIEYEDLDGRGSRFAVVLPAAPPGTVVEGEIG